MIAGERSFKVTAPAILEALPPNKEAEAPVRLALVPVLYL